jgi:hypothetical protein
MDGNLVPKNKASLLVSLIFMAYVQVGEWNFILNLNISIISSSLLDVLNMIEAGSSTSKTSSLSVLEVDLDLVISHTFKHLTGEFEPSKRYNFCWVLIVEYLNCIASTWSTLKSILTNLAFLIVVCKLVTILASDFVD